MLIPKTILTWMKQRVTQRRLSTNRRKRGALRSSERLEDRTLPALVVWTGDVDANWGTNVAGDTNWAGDVLPADGDDLLFPAVAANFTNNNDIAGLDLSSIEFGGTSYVVSGNAVSINGVANAGVGLEDASLAGTNVLNLDITLAADVIVAVNALSSTFTLGGAISGGFGLTKTGLGTLVFSGSTSNTYSGTTTVNDGTLLLSKSSGSTAIAGDLTVGDGSGLAGSAVVRLSSSNQIADSSSVTVEADGRLDLNGNNETIASLTVNGSGTVTTGIGLLTLSGPLVINGTDGNDTLVVTGSGANAGSYVLNGGDPVNFAGITSFTFNALGGDDSATINTLTLTAGTLALDGGTGTDAAIVTGSSASNSSGDGLHVQANETLTVSSSTFNDNDGEGIEAVNVGVVTFTNVTATGNDPGVLINGAVSFSDTDGNFSNNDDHGIQLIDISGNVTLIRTTADNNDANDDGIGDGLNATANLNAAAIGGNLLVQGARFRDSGGVTDHQERGVFVSSIAGSTTFENSTGIVQSVEVTGNEDDGVQIDNAANVTLTNGTYSNNGDDGIDITNAGIVTLTNVTADGNRFDGVELGESGSIISVVISGGSFSNSINADGIDVANVSGTVAVTNATASGNDDDGLEIDNATGGVTLTSVTANNNGGDGADIDPSGDVNITGGTYNNNTEDGIELDDVGNVTITGTSASGNSDDGIDINNAGNVTINLTSANLNTGDGIDLANVGAVVLTSVVAAKNDPGVVVNGAASFSDTNGIYVLNNNGGVVLSNITGAVSLTNTTAAENDADEDNVGDGLNMDTIGGPIVILGGTYSDPDVDADDQENGIVLTNSAAARIYIGNDGTTVSAVTASGNVDDGIDLDTFSLASIDTVTANSNGDFGFEVSNGSTVVLSDLTLAGNATNGGSLDTIGTVGYTTNKAATGSVADTLRLSATQIERQIPAQQIIQYSNVGLLSVMTGLGNDTINVEGTGATVQTQVFGGSGNDTITVAGSSLTAVNFIVGDSFEDFLVADTIGGVTSTPAASPGNDEIILNIVTDITATFLQLLGDDNAVALNSANRDRVTINNDGPVNALTFDWSQNGSFGLAVTGFAIPVNIITTETVQYNDTVGDDSDVTLVGQSTGDDEITVVPVSATTAVAFLGGDPFEDTSELPFGSNLPGFAGGGDEPDLSFSGLDNTSITVDGNGSTGPIGDQLFVYGQTEAGLIDPVAFAAGYTIFNNLAGYGAGELLNAVGAGNAFDDIVVTDTLVQVNGFVEVVLDPNDFVQVNPTLTSGLIVNSGDEAAPLVPDPDCDGFRADEITVTLSATIPITINGGDPPQDLDPGEELRGDKLNIVGTFEKVQVWSDKSSPPTVSFEFDPLGPPTALQPLRESSIECHGPISTITLELIGDNNNPAIDQTDNYVVVGEDVDFNSGGDADGANELTLSINGSVQIPFTDVQYLNVFGDDETAAGDAAADTLEVTPYADYSNGGVPPTAPLSWGIDTFFNEGGVVGDDGDQQDLLIVNGVAGVSEVTTLRPSDEEDGQVIVQHVDGTLIAAINYVANIGFIFNGNDGSLGDTDTLTLRGTDGVTPGTSGNETVVVNYDNAGTAAAPFITVSDSGGGTLYTIHNLTNYDVVGLELLAGNDSVTLIDTAAGTVGGFENTTLAISLDEGNDSVSATGSTTARAYSLSGGNGNDTLVGGGGNDSIYGGNGDDILIGGAGADQEYGEAGNDRFGDALLTGNGVADDPGADTMQGGDGIDQFIWEPGDGSDVIQGGNDGADVLRFFGSAGSDSVVLSAAAGAPTHLNVVLGAATVDTHGIEQVNVSVLGGGDTVTVNDLTTTEVASVLIDLGTADGAGDSAIVNGRSTSDDLLVRSPAAGTATVQGLDYDVSVSNGVAGVDTLTVNGNDGNDTLKAVSGTDSVIGIVLSGGSGDDVLSADATLDGGTGNDTLEGGEGNDSLVGGDGDDTILFRVGGTDTINGGSGFDIFLIETAGGDDTITFSQTSAIVNGGTETLVLSNVERFVVNSGSGNDTLTANMTDAVTAEINAGNGNDSVNGAGSSAALEIQGGDGNDSLVGGSGADSLFGGNGNDTLIGGAGADHEYGEAGNDQFGDGSLTGNGVADDAGADLFFGGDGIDQFVWEPGDGSDSLQGGDDAGDILRFLGSAAGEAFLLAANASAPTHLNVTLGAATVDTHGVEQVLLSAGAGGDTITVGDLSTTEVKAVNIDLGSGDGAPDGVTVNGRNTNDDLAVSSSGAGSVGVQGLSYDVSITSATTADTLTVNGNDGNDTIKANAGVEATIGITFNGGNGNDTLSADATLNGDAGNDTLISGAGNDTINGGAGTDRVVATGDVNFTLTNTTLTGLGIDTLISIEEASLTGGDSGNTFNIGAFTGNTTVTGAGGADTLDFSAATAAINIDLDIIGSDQVINLAQRRLHLGDAVENLTATSFNDTINVDIGSFDRTIDGGDETSIPPGDRLIVDVKGANSTVVKNPNLPKSGSFEGTVNAAGYLGTIFYDDIETLTIKNGGPTGGFGGAGGPFLAATDYLVGKGPRGVQLGQLNDDNGDGVVDDLDNLDMVVANSRSKFITVRLGTGFGTFGPAMNFGSSSYSTTVVLGDVNGDGNLDAVVALRSASKLGVLLGNGDGTFGAVTTFTTGTNKYARNGRLPTSVKLADMNGDGFLDAVTANAGSHTVSVLLNDGAGGFGPVGSALTFKTGGSTPRDLVAADFDQDGNTDVVVTNLYSKNVSFLSGNGDGTLNAGITFATGSQPTSIVAADFNADGNLDVAVTNQLSKTISVLLGNGAAGPPQFQEQLRIHYPLIALDVSLAVGDFNGDGNLDLAIANRLPNTLSILLGFGNGTFTNRFDNSVGEILHRQPVSIAVGDLNHDGGLDVIVANPGTNDVSVLLRNTIP